MIIIADSGSTKTDWRIVAENGKIIQFQTIGLNPYHTSAEQIAAVFQKDVIPKIPVIGEMKSVYFYGSGCSNEAKKGEVKNIFQKQFKNANIFVEHDLLGAARATCKDESGIAAILGTGSNSCIYDGENIINNVPALGYVLGDEGSGAYMGKKLIRAYLYKEMPENVREAFERYYKDISIETILEQIYRKPFPNRYIASFARFLYHKKSNKFIKEIIVDSFEDFFRYHILKYENYQSYKLHAVGSIAIKFYEFLHFVAEKHGVAVGNIIEKPIAGLTLYHEQNK